VFLYVWNKKITRSEDGTIISFERIKVCPIKKHEYAEWIKIHKKSIEPRFERLWNYFLCNNYKGDRTGMLYYEKVKSDLKEYPDFVEKLKEYFEKRWSFYKDINVSSKEQQEK
jgi:hypothetical protein